MRVFKFPSFWGLKIIKRFLRKKMMQLKMKNRDFGAQSLATSGGNQKQKIRQQFKIKKTIWVTWWATAMYLNKTP
jgi:hypothetical protein